MAQPDGSEVNQATSHLANMSLGGPPRRKHKAVRVYDASWASPNTFDQVPSPGLASPAISDPHSMPTAHGAGAEAEDTDRETDVNVRLERLPSVPSERAADQDRFRSHVFDSLAQRDGLAPLATTDFVARDTGNATPKFIRPTTALFPASSDVAAASGVPLALLIQPLAQQRAEEAAVPVVDLGPNGPPRCNRCRTYINPFMQFIDGGSRIVCNHCLFAVRVPDDYFAPTDAHGRRHDIDSRPELQCGTVDFVVGPDYWLDEGVPPPRTLHRIFAIDVSEDALKKGIPGAACAAIKAALYCDDVVEERIAIVTFDRSLHFYNLSPELTQAAMMVVSDVSEAFVPMAADDGLFVDAYTSRHVIEPLLDAIEGLFARERVHEPALGAVLEASAEALQQRGGTLTVFVSALPTWGPGALRFREQTQLYGTDTENTMFTPQDIYWNNLGERCVNVGMGVDMFIFPAAYVDVATVGTISSMTGGDLFAYFNFVCERDQAKIAGDLRRTMVRETGTQALMTVRCSNGLTISQFMGNFMKRGPHDIQLGRVDADKAIMAVVKHDGKLDTKLSVYFQSALLYTSASTGQRRVRCQNYSMRTTTRPHEVIRAADLDAILAYLARRGVDEAITMSLRLVREHMFDFAVKLLACYKRQSSTAANASKLVLPDNLKTLPVMVLALTKCRAFRTGSLQSDVRTHCMRMLRGMSAQALSLLLYPQIIALHALREEEGFPDEFNLLDIPCGVRASSFFLEPGGAYLVNTGQSLLLYLHEQVNPLLLRDLISPTATGFKDLNPRLSTLPAIDSRISVQTRNIQAYLMQLQPFRSLSTLQLARQKLDGAEHEVLAALVEDAGADCPGYKEYLASQHRQIQAELTHVRRSDESGIDITSLWQGRF